MADDAQRISDALQAISRQHTKLRLAWIRFGSKHGGTKDSITQAVAARDVPRLVEQRADIAANVQGLKADVLAPSEPLLAQWKEVQKLPMYDGHYMRPLIEPKAQEAEQICEKARAELALGEKFVGVIDKAVKQLKSAQAKAAKSIKEAAAAAETELKRAEAYLIDYAKMGDRCFPKLEPALKAAEDAAAQRDAAGFEAARKAFNSPYFEFLNLDPELAQAGVPKDLRQFEEKHLKAPLPAKLQKEMKARVDAAAKTFAPTAERMRQAEEMFARMQALKVEAVPVKKAAEAIEIDPKHAKELQEAMVGDESKVRAKLKALAGKLRTKLTGDEMFKRLRAKALV